MTIVVIKWMWHKANVELIKGEQLDEELVAQHAC